MNILINFRYISMMDISSGSISDATESEELNLLAQDFKRLALEYKKLNVKAEEFLNNDKIYKDALEFIRKLTLNWIDAFNKSEKYYCYLWLDEICSVLVDGFKATPLEDVNDYANFEDLKHTVQSCVFQISEKDNTITPENFSDVFFVVYLDIIEKDFPSFSFNSAWYKY